VELFREWTTRRWPPFVAISLRRNVSCGLAAVPRCSFQIRLHRILVTRWFCVFRFATIVWFDFSFTSPFFAKNCDAICGLPCYESTYARVRLRAILICCQTQFSLIFSRPSGNHAVDTGGRHRVFTKWKSCRVPGHGNAFLSLKTLDVRIAYI